MKAVPQQGQALATPWLPVPRRVGPGTRCTGSADREETGGPLTRILNEEGPRLGVHLDVLKAGQGLPVGHVVTLHGPTGGVFGRVPRDSEAPFSGQQFHVPWLQRAVSYADSATVN